MINYSGSIYPWTERATEIITMSPKLIRKKKNLHSGDREGKKAETSTKISQTLSQTTMLPFYSKSHDLKLRSKYVSEGRDIGESERFPRSLERFSFITSHPRYRDSSGISTRFSVHSCTYYILHYEAQ